MAAEILFDFRGEALVVLCDPNSEITPLGFPLEAPDRGGHRQLHRRGFDAVPEYRSPSVLGSGAGALAPVLRRCGLTETECQSMPLFGNAKRKMAPAAGRL